MDITFLLLDNAEYNSRHVSASLLMMDITMTPSHERVFRLHGDHYALPRVSPTAPGLLVGKHNNHENRTSQIDPQLKSKLFHLIKPPHYQTPSSTPRSFVYPPD